MASQVNVDEAKTHFSKLLARASAGEEIVIAKAGKPVARLMPIAQHEARKRVPGIDKGKIRMSKDFDAANGEAVASVGQQAFVASMTVEDAIEAMLSFGRGRSLGGVTIRDLIEEGQRQ